MKGELKWFAYAMRNFALCAGGATIPSARAAQKNEKKTVLDERRYIQRKGLDGQMLQLIPLSRNIVRTM